MSDSPSNPPQETTPLTQDHENQENASAQEPPPPYNPHHNPKGAPSQTEGSPSPHPRPKNIEIPRSVPHAPATTTVFVAPLEFDSKPARVLCPHCNVSVTTRIEHEAGTLTWLLCCFVCICVLCCDFTKDVNHYCPKCERRLGRYHRPCSSRIAMFVVAIIVIDIVLGIVNAMISQPRRYG
uniref:LITAF domain-containing protein n=1 Tax=Acrobeloides nanus TaxID=290746 RepID=A0A914D6V4_9BILA